MSYDEWKKVLAKDYAGEYIPLSTAGGNANTGADSIVYIKSLSTVGAGQSNAVLVISITSKSFKDTMQGISSLHNAWGIILDKNNNILYSTRPMDYPVPLEYAAMSDSGGLLHGKMGKEDVIISYITSKVESLKYISIMPESVFGEKVEYIRKLIILSIVSSIILGGIRCLPVLKEKLRSCQRAGSKPCKKDGPFFCPGV